mmetsp:Transcript_27354/g.76729  ORF Transcript_27354/g.76729 Transcript_27354/m.76729 type:complete len:280 (+) Transcript_27354:813-1652(+)
MRQATRFHQVAEDLPREERAHPWQLFEDADDGLQFLAVANTLGCHAQHLSTLLRGRDEKSSEEFVRRRLVRHSEEWKSILLEDRLCLVDEFVGIEGLQRGDAAHAFETFRPVDETVEVGRCQNLADPFQVVPRMQLLLRPQSMDDVPMKVGRSVVELSPDVPDGMGVQDRVEAEPRLVRGVSSYEKWTVRLAAVPHQVTLLHEQKEMAHPIVIVLSGLTLRLRGLHAVQCKQASHSLRRDWLMDRIEVDIPMSHVDAEDFADASIIVLAALLLRFFFAI